LAEVSLNVGLAMETRARALDVFAHTFELGAAESA
jgi:hypothetical protein